MAYPQPVEIAQVASIPSNVFGWLAAAVANPLFEFSVGAFGAFGQFSRERRTYVEVGHSQIVAKTETSAIAINRHCDLLPIAFENLSSDAFGWNPVIALCLPAAKAEKKRNTYWSNSGPDTGAIDPEARTADRYEVGLGTRYADILIRPGSPTACFLATAACGERFQPEELMGLFPDERWVFETALGRIETSHTRRRHFIPQLLSREATHVVGAPIPEGYVPVGYAFPVNPRHASTEVGESCYDEWEGLLDRFGPPELVRWKRNVQRAMAEDLSPAAVPLLLQHAGPLSRAEIATLRVAIRQRRWLRREPIRPEWEELFDPALSRSVA